jgi:hypothetical protein
LAENPDFWQKIPASWQKMRKKRLFENLLLRELL